MDCQLCGTRLQEDEVRADIGFFSDGDCDDIFERLTVIAKCDYCGTHTRVDTESEEGSLSV